jgi:hypothetical protein
MPMENVRGKLKFAGRSILRVLMGGALMAIPALALIFLHGSASARQQDAAPAKNAGAKPAAGGD